jgi:hypothetical protein
MSESLTFVDNTTNTEDATWILAIPVAGADETARLTVNAAGVTLGGAVGIAGNLTVDGTLTGSVVSSNATGKLTTSNLTVVVGGVITFGENDINNVGQIKCDGIEEDGTGGVTMEGMTFNDGAYTDVDGSVTVSNATFNGFLRRTPVTVNVANAGTVTPVTSVILLNPTGWQGAIQGTNTVYLAAPGTGAAGNILTVIVPSTASNEVKIAAGATGLWTTPSQLATNDCVTYMAVSATKWARIGTQNN